MARAAHTLNASGSPSIDTCFPTDSMATCGCGARESADGRRYKARTVGVLGSPDVGKHSGQGPSTRLAAPPAAAGLLLSRQEHKHRARNELMRPPRPPALLFGAAWVPLDWAHARSATLASPHRPPAECGRGTWRAPGSRAAPPRCCGPGRCCSRCCGEGEGGGIGGRGGWEGGWGGERLQGRLLRADRAPDSMQSKPRRQCSK